MQNPQIGQRWIVDTDASLGLGLIVDIDGRRLTLEFPATGESRQYAIKNAPLTRVVFGHGETIETEDGLAHQVERVENINDLLIYINQDGDPIPETQLASNIKLNHPLKRLLSGQLDKPSWFDVREQLAHGHQQWLRSNLQGLIGARISLTAHQLYVAEAATSRSPVRILLADEVGLGKTIEAGLILQRLQLNNTVSRTLILVPEALCVQWFVELLRCFSIYASLVDEESDCNESRVFIAPHHFIEDERVLSSDSWDMVIVDEAHHFDLLSDNARGNSLNQLADHTSNLLFLSATPERLGMESHFARLRCLDGEKFFDFSEFEKAYQRYQHLANDLEALINTNLKEAVPKDTLDQLGKDFNIDFNDSITKESLLELLLDTYGTGRMVYRNTRQGIAGFPKRNLIKHVLDGSEAKLDWLKSFVKQHSQEKSLLITHEKHDVLDLKEWIYRKTGIDCPVFHEDMTLIERDRAAAYFADAEEGAPLLLCSEIGSEGRNFQFCRRLICWDLPDHPDVLEQRIGRLDRIGQSNDIDIHVCVESAIAEQRLHWFHDVLGSIEKINPAAGVIHDKWYDAYIQDQEKTEAVAIEELSNVLEQLEQGRDRLLEINSCRQPRASELVEQIQQIEEKSNPQELLESLCDVLNLHYEQLDTTRFSLVPSDQMLVPIIPGIPVEGCEITFDRESATAREDIEFVTWDHPLMQGLTEMISLSDLGVASVGLLPNKSLQPGMLFTEVLFSLSIQSSQADEVKRFLSESGLRVVVTDKNPSNLSKALPSSQLNQLVETASKKICKTVVSDYRQLISDLTAQAETLALSEMKKIIDESIVACRERASLEFIRLKQLQHGNDAITDTAISDLKQYYHEVEQALLNACKPQVSAIRILVTYRPEN